MSFLRCFWLGLLILVLGMRPAAAAPRNIILITLDTTRADRMGFLGSQRGLTPNLDRLARQSVVFTRAYSHVPLTTASHATILSGTYPHYNHVNDFGVPLPPDIPYLPDLLHHRGYHTAAFVGAIILDPIGGLAPGFDRGFDSYNAGYHIRRNREDRYKTMERRAEDVVARALEWLQKQSDGPFFLWVHLYDAHDPYDPPPPYKTRYASEPYDGEIAYTDAAVGKLFTALSNRGLYNNTLIAVMSDHGEALGEHGERTHGIFLYDETIHVPLLFKLPGQSNGKRVNARVGLTDVAPTLLQELGMEVPAAMQGKSLASMMAPATPGRTVAPPGEDRPAYAETDYPRRAFGWSSLRSLRASKYLFIQAPERELYDQSVDPQASRNLANSAPAVARTLESQLSDFRAKTSREASVRATLEPEQVQKLQALGYVASDVGKSDAKSDVGGTDPKDKIEVANLLHFAILDVENANYSEAVPKLEKVLAEQPEMAVANMQLGTALARLQNYDKAIGPLKKAVELVPNSGMSRYELGLALYETGDGKAAAAEFEETIKLAPKWADAHFSLAAVYARIDRVPEAMTELDAALGFNPDHYRAHLLRGRILSLQGRPEDALANLEKAVKLQPESREAHLFLAQAYAQLGREADAQKERAKAQSLGR